MASSNLKILYLLEIMRTTNKDHTMNAKDISEKMENDHGIRITRQMVYQLIETLQECGYPIENCKSKNAGWYMKHHDFEDFQLKIMIDAVTNSRCITAQESREIRNKLMALTSKRGRDKLRSLYSPKPQNKPRESNIQESIELIMEASLTGRKIVFNYTYIDFNLERKVRMDGDRPKEYELNPYSMQWSDENYYVIGGHDKYKPDLTNYRLDRMENIRISEASLIPKEKFLGDNPDFKIQDYIDKNVDNFHGERFTVSLALLPTVTNMKILYDFVGEKPRVSHLDGEYIKVSFRTSDTPTLRGWLIKNGTSFKVLEPATLRDEIVDEVKAILKLYGDVANGDCTTGDGSHW